MNKKEEIIRLKEHIDNLNVELRKINFAKKNLSADEFLNLSNQYKSFVNMALIAKNELYALLHQYSLSLYGEISDNKGQVVRRKKHVTLFTEVDYGLSSRARTQIPVSLDSNLMSKIKEEFSVKFNQGNFEVTRIKQLR